MTTHLAPLIAFFLSAAAFSAVKPDPKQAFDSSDVVAIGSATEVVDHGDVPEGVVLEVKVKVDRLEKGPERFAEQLRFSALVKKQPGEGDLTRSLLDGTIGKTKRFYLKLPQGVPAKEGEPAETLTLTSDWYGIDEASSAADAGAPAPQPTDEVVLTPETSRDRQHLFTIAILVLGVALGAVGLRFLLRKTRKRA